MNNSLRRRPPWRRTAPATLAAALLLVAAASRAQPATAPAAPPAAPPASAPVAAPSGALGSSLRGLLDEARRSSPELAAMRLEADAAAQRVQPAGALPDPVLRIERDDLRREDRSGWRSALPWRAGETTLTLMQPLPVWGKRDLRRDVAAADARRADAQAAATWAELAQRIKTVQAQRVLAAGSERLAREVLDLVGRLEQVALARYAGGLVPQQDALRAQLEQTAMRAELIQLRAQQRQLQARLNALLARDADAALAEPQDPSPLPAATTLQLPLLLQRARAGNPAALAEAARLQGAEAGRELVVRNRYPDVTVGVTPTRMDSGGTRWGLMVELMLPLQQSARRAQEREAQQMVDAARARREAIERQLAGDLAEQLAALQAARDTEALLARQALPQAELGLKSALVGYENDQLGFAELLEAQRQIRRTRLELLKTQAEAHMRLADIERIVGDEL